MFIQNHPPTGPTIITGNITGLPAGKHGLHIHQSGDLRNGCEKLGGHFNPFFVSNTLNFFKGYFWIRFFFPQLRHGAPSEPLRHVGDLGNVEAGEDGVAEVNVLDPLVSLSLGPRGIVGRALVVTADPDDLGLGGTADSLLNGQSGRPLGCGVIAYVR